VSPDAALLESARRLGWASQHSRPARIAIVAASVAVVIEALYFLPGAIDPIQVGFVPVSPSTIPALVAAVAGGRRLLGRPRSQASARLFWATLTVALSIGAFSITMGRSATSVLGLLLAGLNEELVYRGAAPAIAAFGLARLGCGPRAAGIGGLAVGSFFFVILPGHVAQWNGWPDVAPFVAFSIISGLAVWRTGALLEVGIVHGIVNMINFTRIDGGIGSSGGVLVGLLVLTLVVAYVPSERSPDILIDLTPTDRGADPIVAEIDAA
jgi:membrane protease YdiL (CAAX protease family)